MSNALVQLQPDSISPELARWLQQFTAQPDAPDVHPYPISFYEGSDRRNWLDSLPGEDSQRHTFSEWWNARHEGKKVWIGLFSTPTANWIQDPEWDSRPWHVWGAAVLHPESGQGKYIIIWDCDPKEPFNIDGTMKRHKSFLLTPQYKLIQWLRRTRGVKVLGVFYHVDQSRSGQDRCLQHTCDWIQRMVEFGNNCFQGWDEQGNSSDERTTDCVYTTTW
jgi:hypothetical protein